MRFLSIIDAFDVLFHLFVSNVKRQYHKQYKSSEKKPSDIAFMFNKSFLIINAFVVLNLFFFFFFVDF